MKPLKVLMVVPNLRVANGVASFAMNYFRDLDQSKIHVDFALYADRSSPYYDEIRMRGSDIYILPKVSDIRKHLKKCNEILSTKKYDIVHDNTLHISIPMMWCAKQAGVPVRILHAHSSKLSGTRFKELRNQLLVPFLCSLATHYVACSGAAGKVLFGNRRFDIIPNVIPVSKYKYNQERRNAVRTSMNAESKFVVGSVGRLAVEKNPYFAVDVIKKLHEEMPDIEYWWIGSGDLDNQVKEYVESCGALSYIKLLGSRNDVADLYQAMDVFLLTSFFEGMPLTCIEAQAMGLPMIVSDTITTEMLYTDLVDYLNLSEPVEVWVEHLKKAVQKKRDREQYAEYLKRSRFSDVGCGNRLERIYRQFMDT